MQVEQIIGEGNYMLILNDVKNWFDPFQRKEGNLGKHQKRIGCSARRMTVAALLVVLLSGCMTIASREGPSDYGPVYSGTVFDLKFITYPVFAAMGKADPDLFNMQYYPMFVGIFLLDLPFSLVADTLLLPITISEQKALNRKKQDDFEIQKSYDFTN